MSFVVPTIFTGVNNYSKVVAVMGNDTAKFTQKLTALDAKVNSAFGGVGGGVARATKTLLAYGEAALFIEGTLDSARAITDYENEVANLSAVTGATGNKLQEFKDDILDVAHATKRAANEVAQAFTNVDNNLPQFHDNAAALSEVTKEAITLAKAGRMELGPAAESLTLSMNQFGHGAADAARDIDALAAGAVAGSSRIAETSEALQKFGAVAANVAHVTYAESVALVELGSKFEKGTEEGTRLRNILLDMTNVKFGPAAQEVRALGVDLNKVSNVGLPFIDRFKELSKIRNNPEAMEKLFDKRNVAMASGLFSVIDNYNKVYAATSKVGTAEHMAAVNTDTLSESVKQLKAAWFTEISTSNKASSGITHIKNVVQFLTDHMGELVDIIEYAGGTFLIWKAVVKGSSAALWIYNTTTGLAAGLTSNLTGALSENTIAFKAETAAIKARNFYMRGGVYWTLLALSSYKALRQELDKTAREKAANPMGLDFEKSADDNRKILDRYHIPDSQFDKWKQKYQAESQRQNMKENMDPWKNPIGVGILSIAEKFRQEPIAVQQENVDSVRNAVDAMYNKLGSTDEGVDVGMNKYDQKAGEESDQDHHIKVTIDNNTGYDAKVNNNGSPIPVNLGSTFKRGY